MSQGLFTAGSGITTNQARIDVISDNIANLNTVAFKSSQVNFKTIFSRTLSGGSPPSGELGGINPREVGLGVTVGEIAKNFDNGSIQSTGRSTDLNIQGEGFFTVQNSEGETLLTRAGNFSVDAEGNLVNPDGLKVMGTSQLSGTSGGSVPVQIPTELNFVTPNATGTTDAIGNVGQAAGSTITDGTFTIDLNGGTLVSFDLSDTLQFANTQMDTIASTIQSELIANGANAATQVDYDTTNNRFEIDVAGGDTLSFGGTGDTSNFISVCGFTAGAPGYVSEALFDHSQITMANADNSDDTYTITTYSIGNNGSVEATYSNGAKLTVETLGGSSTRSLKYVSPSGREVSGANITNSSSTVADQLQIQLATVVNPEGLNAKGGNLFGMNSIAGDVTYAIGGSGGLGVINAGALEASNVNLPQEFANMILAQRGVEANSRTFSVQDQILRQIVNLGR